MERYNKGHVREIIKGKAKEQRKPGKGKSVRKKEEMVRLKKRNRNVERNISLLSKGRVIGEGNSLLLSSFSLTE